tara:strand:+ start:495 stop:728 length:234 start_codon:yes stop_codon:yes gene_type:complete
VKGGIMLEDNDVDFEQIDDSDAVPDQQLWAHEVLNEFEALIDVVGVESVMFLMTEEHENILKHYVKEGVDIQHRVKQ